MTEHLPLLTPDTPPRLQTERLLLRPLEARDRAQRLACGRDREFHRLVGGDPARAGVQLTPADVDRWYARHVAEPLFWVIEAGGRMIGTAWLHTLQVEHRRVRFAIGIFAPENRGRGYGGEATDRVLAYAFGALRAHRVELRVLEFNTGAIRMYERCGFIREGVEREGVWIGGIWHDELMMAVLEQEYAAGARAT